MARIQVTVITGFLGSGKTTLLNALLQHPDMSQAAVIVNEFGEIGLDYDLVERSDESVVQLENGCLCCTVKSDLIDTFRDLHLLRLSGKFPKFDRVAIETTGIADPGPVLQIILTDPLVSSCYSLDGVVTTIDAINGENSLDRFAESVKQAAIADRIFITKGDLLENTVRDEKIGSLEARLKAMNPGANIVQADARDIKPSDLFGHGLMDPRNNTVDVEAWLQAEAYVTPDGTPVSNAGVRLPRSGQAEGDTKAYYESYGHQPADMGDKHDDDDPLHAHDPLINSFVLVREDPVSMETLRLFLDALAREAGPDLLRVKGIVNVAERPETPAVIQGAQQIFHSLEWLPTWPNDDLRTRIVFITRGLDQAYIEDSFELIERVAARTVAAGAGVPAQF
jgi:G3E family GTPase